MLDAAKTIEPTRGCAVTVLMADLAVSIGAEGQTVTRQRAVYRIETEAGLSNWSSVHAAWDPWHQKQPVVRARVVTRDGVEHVLDPKTFADAPARQYGAETFSDTRLYRGPLPAVAVGALVEEEVTLEDTEPVFPGGAVGRMFAGGQVPVLETRIVIEVPAAVALKYEVRLLPGAKVTKTEIGGTTRVTIETGKLDPIDSNDTNIPPEAAAWPQVEYSTAASWSDMAKMYLGMSEPQIRTDQVTQIVRETIDANDSREEKIRKLTARLHKDVRYTGVEFGRLKIVPQPPAEVLRRKYGDCKDKATTLVAMLRAAGVPAHLVLLDSGTGHDVTPSLPGANLFNHVIVLAEGKPDIWIDATDQYTRPGRLPIGDQGRWGLPIREGTTELVRIPATTGMDNLLVEKIEYQLSEYGPATVIEESESSGFTERGYRSYYDSVRGTKRVQNELEEYSKSNYVADGEVKFELGDGLDLEKPFVLRIEAHKARRGYTTLQDARALILPAGVAGRLPDYFRKSDDDIKKEDEKRERPRAPRAQDFVLQAPFVTEWQCRVVPPPGFKLRSMPESKSEDLGPAKLTQHWEAAQDGSVVGTIRFDTVKARYTVAEAETLRKAVVEFRKANGLIVAFDQQGYALLAAGKGKEAITAFDSLIKLHPTEALHHVQMASALLDVGLGETARKEAREAVRLEPKSAMAHNQLAWTLQHDLVGRRFKKGFDLAGALAEYRTAIECDPDDDDIRANYAILLEYDASGERYSETTNLAESVAQYRKLKDKNYNWEYLDNNLYTALLWSFRWKEVEEFVSGLPANDDHNSVLIAARTALAGAPSGIRRAAELTSNEKAKADALVEAGNKLLLARRYQDAAALWEAANAGGSALEAITAVRNTHRYTELPLPANDAAGAVKEMLTYLLGPRTPDPKIEEVFLSEWKEDGTEGPVGQDSVESAQPAHSESGRFGVCRRCTRRCNPEQHQADAGGRRQARLSREVADDGAERAPHLCGQDGGGVQDRTGRERESGSRCARESCRGRLKSGPAVAGLGTRGEQRSGG